MDVKRKVNIPEEIANSSKSLEEYNKIRDNFLSLDNIKLEDNLLIICYISEVNLVHSKRGGTYLQLLLMDTELKKIPAVKFQVSKEELLGFKALYEGKLARMIVEVSAVPQTDKLSLIVRGEIESFSNEIFPNYLYIAKLPHYDEELQLFIDNVTSMKTEKYVKIRQTCVDYNFEATMFNQINDNICGGLVGGNILLFNRCFKYLNDFYPDNELLKFRLYIILMARVNTSKGQFLQTVPLYNLISGTLDIDEVTAILECYEARISNSIKEVKILSNLIILKNISFIEEQYMCVQLQNSIAKGAAMYVEELGKVILNM